MPLAGQRAAAGDAAALPQWSNALRAIREARGVSQAGWAARLGRSRNTVQRWESGSAVPDQEAEQAIIDYCRGHALFDLPLYDGALTADGLCQLLAVARLGGVAPSLPPVGRSLDAVVAAGPAQPAHTSLPESVGPAAARGARRRLLVGREAELALLREQLAAAQAGHGSLVLLVGEPGIGKTRLAEELAAEAQRTGVSVLWGRCWEGEGAPPFWPWRELLRTYSEQQCPRTLRTELGSGAAALTQLLPELRERLPGLPEPPPLDPEAARFRLFDAASQALAAVAQARPLLVLLDDLHWADKPSLLLLQFLVQRLGAMRLLLVGTYRDTDLDQRHPLAEVLPALRRTPDFERLLLHGLSRHEVERLLALRAGHELDAAGRRLSEAVHHETEGNPFFIEELLRHLAESGTLRQRDGRWTVVARSIAELGIPEGVREVIGRRLTRLSERTNRLLTLASVIGREFDAALLERVAQASANDLDDAIGEAEQARVIIAVGKGGERYSFSHALIRETLFADIPVRRRAQLHRQVGEALEAHYRARLDQHAAELAFHFAEAGEREQALRYGRLAAEQAERTTAWEEAARHYERCLTLMCELERRGAGDSARPTEGEAALLLALGRCWRNAGAHREAWRSLMRAIELYHARDDGVGHANATLEALEIFAPPQRQAELVRAALRGLGEDDAAPQLAGRLLALLLDPWRTGRREAEESQLRKRVERLVERYGLAEVPALLTFGDAWRGWLASDFAAAAADYRRAHVGLDAQGRTGLAAQALFWNALSLLNQGRLQTGTAAMEEALSYAQRPQLRFVADNAPAYLAGLQLAHGCVAGFDALVAGRGPSATWVWDVLQALRCLQAGELERAVALLPEPARAGSVPDWVAMVHGVRAWVLWQAGEPEAARQEWLALRAVLPAAPDAWLIDDVVISPWAIYYTGDALPHLADKAFLVAAERWLQSREALGRGRVFVPEVAACGLRQAALVPLALGQLDQAETRLQRSLAWCEQAHCLVEVGRCLQGLAEVAAQRGEHAAALTFLQRAAALFRQHEATLYLRQVQSKIDLRKA